MRFVVTLVFTLLLSPFVQADIMALKGSLAVWNAEGEAPLFDADAEQQFSATVALEHPIPIIPNVKLRYWDYSEVDSRIPLELTTMDAILYYEIFDNDVIDLDLGVSATNYLDGRAFGRRSFDGWLPQVYGATRIHLSDSGFGLYGEATATNWDDSQNYDLELGVDYRFDMPVLDLSFRLGYRQVENDFDDFDNYTGKFEFKGWTLGVLVDL